MPGMPYSKRDVVNLLMEVRDRLAEIGTHACPGFDCATCRQSQNIEELEIAIAEVQRFRLEGAE